MDTAQWPQGIGVVKNKPVESSPSCVNPSTEKKSRPQKEQALHCPRCSSTNTKFCYYNNYSLTQPRYFCKTCRRYWTEGGSLRNVPVGGGSRKNRRSSSSSLNSSKKVIIDNNNNLNPPPNYTPQNPKIHQVQDPSLAYSAAPHQFNGISEFIPLPSFSALDVSNNMNLQNPIGSSSDTSHRIPIMELLKTGNMGSRGLNSSSFLSFPVHNSNSSVYPSLGFHLHDQIKPSLSFSLDGFDLNGCGNVQGVDEGSANLSRNGQFPFEESSKPASNSEAFEQDRCEGDQSNGFNWNGMLTGGSW